MAELQSFGFKPQSYKVTVIALPETEPIWGLWDRIGNQWRISPAGGAIALDYGPLLHMLDRMDLDEADHDYMFNCIRCIESEVLEIWSEMADAEREKADKAKGKN